MVQSGPTDCTHMDPWPLRNPPWSDETPCSCPSHRRFLMRHLSLRYSQSPIRQLNRQRRPGANRHVRIGSQTAIEYALHWQFSTPKVPRLVPPCQLPFTPLERNACDGLCLRSHHDRQHRQPSVASSSPMTSTILGFNKCQRWPMHSRSPSAMIGERSACASTARL